ncbi:MAG: class I SAM-dependent methyltransferase [Bryobacteraceae bacterium]
MGFLDRFRARPKPAPADLATVRDYFLHAAADEENYPSTIDERILFVKSLIDHLGDLNGKVAADIGSGKGRFARIVKDRNPQATVIALDIAETMLHRVPADIAKVAASMTQLPLATASTDGAYAIESLEHAVDIEAAIAELTRIVKPGGKIVIIDKNIEKWGKLETPSWERWFDRSEIELLLQRHCQSVTSRPISYWEDVAPDGLFLAWFATK